jgi:hypothetical protein
MNTRITALGGQKTVDVLARTLLMEIGSHAEGYRARAAQCQQVADRWSGLIKRQYEDLARQWLAVAEQAERKVRVPKR